jgi:hypothetical protein
MDGYGFRAHVTRVAPIGLVPDELRFGAGFAGTCTIAGCRAPVPRSSTTC